jgi:SAM-dependent methyltransferase
MSVMSEKTAMDRVAEAHRSQEMTTTAMPDLAAVKGRQQRMWAAGDFAQVGATLTIVGETLCEAVGLRAGQRVLDVAAGAGNAALAAARRFGAVTAADYVPEVLERGRERAAGERLPVAFVEGDAEALPFPDASFDVVLSTFGVMFAPDQERAARELLRVCRPGGTIGLANWTAEGWIGDVFRANGRRVPPPAGVASPLLWGNEARLRDLFGDGVAELRATRRDFVFRYRSPEHWLDFWRAYYGPTVTAFAALDADGQAALARDLLDVVARHNQADDGTMVVPGEYLEVVATRA